MTRVGFPAEIRRKTNSAVAPIKKREEKQRSVTEGPTLHNSHKGLKVKIIHE